jgi:hypothetical protein
MEGDSVTSEIELERRVFGPALAAKPGLLVPPDCAWVHAELKRHRHVTLRLLWGRVRGPLRGGGAAYAGRTVPIYGSGDGRGGSVQGAPLCARDGRERLCVCGGDAQ